MRDQSTTADSANVPQTQAKTLLTTASVHAAHRRDWLQETISREYTKVEVTPPSDEDVFNEMSLYELGHLRLSLVRSNALTIDRKKHEPYHISQDNYLGVVLISGHYSMQQGGREVALKPGDMTIYDATRPHRISCSHNLSKLLITIPRTEMHARLAGVEHCTAMRIPGQQGLGAVTAGFIRHVVQQAEHMTAASVSALSEQSLDLFTLSLASLNAHSYNLSRSRACALQSIKDYLEKHFRSPTLDTATVAAGTGLSARYINDLLNDDRTSLMRYILQRRLEQSSKDLTNKLHQNQSISEIALNCGFNDLSHFSRTFKQKYDCSPKDYRNSNLGKISGVIK